MKLTINQPGFGKRATVDMDFVHKAETLGFDAMWTAEAYGNDAVSMAAWLLANTTKLKIGTAIMQMPARTPAMTAMTAMTLDHLSGGRFLLGLGPSGPQVSEGWHGVPYGKPLTRTKEYISIIRKILAREEPVEHRGEYYQMPATGAGATGLGKPLKSILHGNSDIPIITASISPNGLACAAECADGVLPMMINPDKAAELLNPSLEKGFAKRTDGKIRKDFDVICGVTCIIGDYAEMSGHVKSHLALYIGGMGARNKNFYNDYAKRLGYEDAAVKIQDLYLAGKKDEAIAAVPDALIDDVHLVGPEGKIRERLQDWKAAGQRGDIQGMAVGALQPEVLDLLADAML
jgi:F420-dependent oxidoreductase-like protein